MEIKPVILVVEDDLSMQDAYNFILKDKYHVFIASNAEQALNFVKDKHIDLVLLDIMIPDADGVDVLKKIKNICNVEVIMVTAIKTIRTAIDTMKLGAFDYISKPFDIDDLLFVINKALEKQRSFKDIVYLESELKSDIFENIVGKSPQMKNIFSIVSEISNNYSTVLITGESGTGKELIARAIHKNGSRKDNPFIAIDCATIPENLVESELFGHERGAFTDALTNKIGKFELAESGTLFLDEIGNLPIDIQCKLLRVIEEREFQRVGGNKNIKVNTRIITATNIDLKKHVKEGKFRNDLYYRLNVIPIHLPALCDRKEDIPLLIDYFIDKYNKKFDKNIKGICKEALSLMVAYNWPGNIRELRNVIERFVVLSKTDIISIERLPLDILLYKADNMQRCYEIGSLKQARDEFEKQFIVKVLEKVNWNQTKAARLLGIHRNALLYKIELFNLRKRVNKTRLKKQCIDSGLVVSN